MSGGKEMLSGDVDDRVTRALDQAITEGLIDPNTSLEEFTQMSNFDMFELPEKGLRPIEHETRENNRNVHNLFGD